MAGQAYIATELFELVHDDLQQVDREISLRSVASVDAITTISRYYRKAAASVYGPPCCCFPLGSPERVARPQSGWRRSSK